MDTVLLDESPAKWQLECERAAFNISALLRLARRRWSSTAVIELLRNIPRSEAEVNETPIDAIFARLALEAHLFSTYDKELCHAAMEYFSEHLIKLPLARRNLLEASLVGCLLGCAMG